MTERSEWISRRHADSLLSAASAGFFFLLVGVIFITTSSLLDNILDLFRSNGIELMQVPNTIISLPAPNPLGHYLAIFQAAGLFSLIWGIFEIAMLVLRFALRSSTRRKAESAGNIVFWLGTSYFINVYLTSSSITTTSWFAFWTIILMLLGISLIVRAAVLVVMGMMKQTA